MVAISRYSISCLFNIGVRMTVNNCSIILKLIRLTVTSLNACGAVSEIAKNLRPLCMFGSIVMLRAKDASAHLVKVIINRLSLLISVINNHDCITTVQYPIVQTIRLSGFISIILILT